MKKNDRFSPPLIGGSSLLVIFAVLCLTVLAILSLSTTKAYDSLSESSAQSIRDYYAADTAAEEVLAGLRSDVSAEHLTLNGVRVSEGAGDTYSYEIAVNDSTELQVEVFIHGNTYSILKWQEVYTGNWEADDTLDLWDGELEE